MSGTNSSTAAPRRLRFRWAFRATSGSKVQYMVFTPMARSSSLWASLSRLPIRWFLASGRTASMWDQWASSPRRMPVTPYTKPRSVPSWPNAPVTMPFIFAVI